MGRPAVLTGTAMARVRPMVEQGLRPREIAAELGCTVGTLKVRCSQLRISLRRPRRAAWARPHLKQIEPIELADNCLKLAVLPATQEQLRQWAEPRGMSATTLAAALLDTIASDRLCDAVLDWKAD